MGVKANCLALTGNLGGAPAEPLKIAPGRAEYNVYSFSARNVVFNVNKLSIINNMSRFLKQFVFVSSILAILMIGGVVIYGAIPGGKVKVNPILGHDLE